MFSIEWRSFRESNSVDTFYGDFGIISGIGLTSVGVASTGIASIPYVGWVLAGAATMLGMEQGAEIGGQMAMDFAGCEDIDETIS